MFPNILKQSGWGNRVRQSTRLLSAAITELARDTPSWNEVTRLIDSTPAPCGKSRETVKRRPCRACRLRIQRLPLPVFRGIPALPGLHPDGMPIIRGLANPKIGEREVPETLRRHDRDLIQPGQMIVGDKGFTGREFESFIPDEYGAHLIRPDRKDETPRFGKLGGIRHWVESVFDNLKGQITLEEHRGRTLTCVYSRVAGRLLALAAGIWHNWLTGAPSRRSFIAYDH